MYIEIRNTVSTDLARLAALDHSVNTDYVWQLALEHSNVQIDVSFREVRLPRTIKIDHPRSASDLADTWHIRPMFSAMNGMEAIAYIRFTEKIVTHAVWITDLVVGKPYRGQGIGQKLIKSVEDWGSEHGLRKSMIEIQSKNAPAINMARKLGYEFSGYNDQYYATRDVALFFTRAI